MHAVLYLQVLVAAAVAADNTGINRQQSHRVSAWLRCFHRCICKNVGVLSALWLMLGRHDECSCLVTAAMDRQTGVTANPRSKVAYSFLPFTKHNVHLIWSVQASSGLLNVRVGAMI